MRPKRTLKILKTYQEMNNNDCDWDDFMSETTLKSGKQINSTAPTTILEAIENVVNAARYSQLDIAEIITVANDSLQYLCSRLDLEPEEAIIFSVLIENVGDSSITLLDLRGWFDCTNVTILKHTKAFDELMRRGWITSGRNDSLNQGLTFAIPMSTVDALKKDIKPELIDNENLDFDHYFDRLGESFNARRNGIGYDMVVAAIESLTRNNHHLTYCTQMLGLAKELAPSEIYLLHFFAHRAVNHNDFAIGKADMDGLFAIRADCIRHYQALTDGSHPLITKGYIEPICNDGFCKPSAFTITAKTHTELLPEADIPTPELPQVINKSELIKYDDIAPKKLVFSSLVASGVDRLAEMLTAEKYHEICERLQQYGYRKGLTCIFYGAPGTGKTETALQLARKSGRDIMQVNIEDMRSKWVGESEKMVKNLFIRYRRAVHQAEKSGKQVPILLFNEADALLTCRNTAAERSVDKMENAMQNIFLQALETLEGILIATTNLVSNLDPAFERRFLYKVEFTRPDRQIRALIWKNMIADLSDDDAIALANKYDFSGGQIENISRKHIIDAILYGPAADSLPRLKSYCDSELLNTKTSARVGFQL